MVTNINGTNVYKINENTVDFIKGKFTGKISGCSTLSVYAPNSSD